MLSVLHRKALESDRVYRVRSNTIPAVVWLVLANGFAISIVVRAAEANRPFYIFAPVLCAAVMTVLLVRLLWAAILTSAKGVRVANIFVTFELQWSEIERFEISRWKILPRTGVIHLRDGRVKHAAGLGESVNFPNHEGEKMVDELNAELARRAAGGSVPPRIAVDSG